MKIRNLVNEPWFWIIALQIMWFGGLFVASDVDANLIKFILGGIWFSLFVFWGLSKINKWWLKYKNEK